MLRDADNDPEFRRGLTAHANGVALQANPHASDSYGFEVWSVGWQTGRARAEAVTARKAHSVVAGATH